MKLDTENKENGFKLIMKELGKKKMSKPKAFKKLVHPEEGAYKSRSDAKQFLKDLIDSEYPVVAKDNVLVRTDIRGAKVDV